jgi:hypothetical protein
MYHLLAATVTIPLDQCSMVLSLMALHCIGQLRNPFMFVNAFTATALFDDNRRSSTASIGFKTTIVARYYNWLVLS